MGGLVSTGRAVISVKAAAVRAGFAGILTFVTNLFQHQLTLNIFSRSTLFSHTGALEQA